MTATEKKKVLVIAKTEPSPSRKYGSTVCTAGITDKGEFIRLYPIQYRLFCGDDRGFSKYDWIEVECFKKADDERMESYHVVEGTLRIVGHIGTDFNWAMRNEILLPHVFRNIGELEKSGASLGLVKPSELLDFVKTKKNEDGELGEAVSDYRRELQMIFDGNGLMKAIPAIDKIDTYYRYSFRCEGEDTVHNLMCEDWGVYEAARSWPRIYGTKEKTWEKMHEKFFDLFSKEKDLYFFVGTHFRWRTWMVIGVYYPPKTSQKTLFERCDESLFPIRVSRGILAVPRYGARPRPGRRILCGPDRR